MGTQYRREDIQAVVIAVAGVSILSGFFVYPLPPSPTVFDGLGRITLIYSVGAMLIAFFMAPESRSFRNIVHGALVAAFFGAIGGLAVEGFLDFIRS